MGLNDLRIDPLDRPSLPSFLTQSRQEPWSLAPQVRAMLKGFWFQSRFKPNSGKLKQKKHVPAAPQIGSSSAVDSPPIKARLILSSQPVTSPSRKVSTPHVTEAKEPGRALIIIPNPPKRRPPRRSLSFRLWGFGAAASLAVISVLFLTLRLPSKPAQAENPPSQLSFLAQVSVGLGIRVQEILVEGRMRSSIENVFSALQIRRGEAILSFDAEAARQRLQALPWVESAIVERRLPDTVYVHLQERTPYALWQNGGRFHLVDAKGIIILTDPGDEFASLPILVGEGAPQRAEEILLLLEGEPLIRPMIAAAARVGDRRWNLHLTNGIDVRLPEENPAVALGVLADLHQQTKLLDRDIIAIDLRQSDRIVVRLASVAAQQPPPLRPASGEKG